MNRKKRYSRNLIWFRLCFCLEDYTEFRGSREMGSKIFWGGRS